MHHSEHNILFDVNEKCENHYEFYVNGYENKLMYHKWKEYESKFNFCFDDGLFGICYGRAFVLSGTYWDTMLHIFK